MALSGQMPSYFIYVAALLHPLAWHSPPAILLSPFPCRQDLISPASSSECLPFNLILRVTVVTSHCIFSFCISGSYKRSCGTALDEMGKDSFTIARGVILRSGWNQKFCRFQLTGALLNGLSQASVHPAKALRYCCMTAKVAGCITDMYPA